MKLEDIKKLTVIGGGQMGNQIAEVLSRNGGFQVCIADVKGEFVKKAVDAIENRLQRFFVDKGKLTSDEAKTVLSRIRGSTNMKEAVIDADCVIEAVPDIMTLKKDIFRQIDESAPPHAILASNTSNQSITEIASVTARPGQVVGMHFFNPVTVMRLVEVVRGARTSDEVVEVTGGLARKLGKDPVTCRDSYGFLANRAYRALSEEAVQMVWERVATPADIDKALKLGYNLPIGPLELGDMIGSWGIRAAAEPESIMELGAEKGHLHPLLRTMIRAGYSGGPGKKGVYAFWNEALNK